jgi:glutamate-1-semialdehyde 2,1-aminomutase
LKGEKPPFDNISLPGIPEETLSTIAVLPANDLDAVAERLAQGDIAAVILEPSGGSWTTLPLADGFLTGLRSLTKEHGAALIFDEVITGFRWSPGGAQGRFGVTPDLTTMAKIVAGGLPGGAVAGTYEYMQHFEFRDDPTWMKTQKVIQMGTFNANPLTAAAGAAAVRKCANPDIQAYCDNLASQLRAGMNAILVEEGVPGAVWGESSVFHLMVGPQVTNQIAADIHTPEGVDTATLKGSGHAGLGATIQLAMALEGVDLFHGGGLLSVAHSQADVDNTINAFDRVITRLKKDGLVG